MAKTRSADRQRYWREVIERQQASGQSIVGFCSKEGLAPASFHAWKRRLRRPRRETGRKAAKQALVPVQIVSDPPAGAGKLEVQWPGGVVLRVQGCDAQTIGAVVAALSAPTSTKGTPMLTLALVPAGVCQDRPHRYAKVVRGAGWSGGARTGPAGGIGRPVSLLQSARRPREGTLVCGRRPSDLVQAIGRRNL